MKNIFFIVLLTIPLLATSCKEDNIGSVDNIDAVIAFSVLDENGGRANNDLLPTRR